MRICLIIKYPPIEGGVASRVYWLAKELGQRGHEIHIVTNAWEVENQFIEKFEVEDIEDYQPQNVKVHSTSPFLDLQYIPRSNPYTEKLANEAIEVIGKNDLQLIDSFYLLPYGIAGFLAKCFTNRPLLLRHAGSDLSRLYPSPFLRTLFSNIFQKADRIVTYSPAEEIFLRLGIPKTKISCDLKISVDTKAFSPRVKPFDLKKYGVRKNTPIITYIGKIGRSKGIYELIEVLGKIKKEFIFLLVAGGRRKDLLDKALADHHLKSKSILLGFLPPWRIPSVVKASTCVVHPERDFPIKSHIPILPREVMATGRCLIISNELYEKRHSSKIKDGKNVLVIDPRDTRLFKKTLEVVIEKPRLAEKIGHEAWITSKETEDFKGYVDQMERLYQDTIKTQRKGQILR